MKNSLRRPLAFAISFVNPAVLNSLYKKLSGVEIFKKSIYIIVKSIIPPKIKLGDLDLILNQKDAMVSGALALGVYENFESEIFVQNLKADMTVVDIGANIGYYTILASNKVKTILAFEPDTINYEILKKNIAANHCQNISALQLAVGDVETEVQLYGNVENYADRRIYSFADAGQPVFVPQVNLDNFLTRQGIEHVDFIKIDIQGAESLALIGMDHLLNQTDLQLLIEFFPAGIRESGSDPNALLEKLKEKNFEIYNVNGAKKTLDKINDFKTFTKKFKGTEYTNLYCKK